MNNLDLVKRLYTAFSQRDADKIREIFHPDIEWIQNEGFPNGGRHVGADTVLNEVFAKFRTDWDSWRAVVHEWLDTGDAIVALGEYRGKHKVTGKSAVAVFAHVYDCRDNRIIRFRQYTDTAKVTEATVP